MRKLFYILIFSLVLGGTIIINCTGENKAVPVSDIGKEVICPVTGEKFKITKHTKFVDYQGKRYYFCCPGCDKRFLENPEKYLNIYNADSGAIHRTNEVPGQVQNDKGSENEVSYWTCSMHPSVHSEKPGKCPICGMELIPVYKGTENRINIEEEKVAILKIKSVPARMEYLVKKIEIPVRVARDEELYLAQQELISASSSADILNATILKLKLMGFSDDEIKIMKAQSFIDESLIFPGPHRAWLIADIYERDISLVKHGQKVIVKFPAYPEKDFVGAIVAIEHRIDPETRRAKARILLKHPMVNLFPDMYGMAGVEIPFGHSLVIPYSSIIDTGERRLVYVEIRPGVYELRNIKTGIETDDYVQVLDGLKEGEMVVIQGNFFLDSQTSLTGGQALLYGSAEEIKKGSEPRIHQH
jgi:Cu(I)/Ag(I) efflux system membrane fusion protein